MSKVTFSAGRPRLGQWCKLRVRDKAAEDLYKTLGAHVTPDGYLVALMAAASNETDVVLSREGAEDPPVRTPAQRLPPRLVLQTSAGYDLETVVHDDATGANVMRPVWFVVGDTAVAELHPMTDKGHFPPGYVARTFAGEHSGKYRDPLP